MSNRLKRPSPSARLAPKSSPGTRPTPPASTEVAQPPQIKPKLSWILSIFGTLFLLAVLVAGLSAWWMLRPLHHH